MGWRMTCEFIDNDMSINMSGVDKNLSLQQTFLFSFFFFYKCVACSECNIYVPFQGRRKQLKRVRIEKKLRLSF